MFAYNEEHKGYVVEINSIKFLCDEVSEELEEQAKELAECYEDKLPELIDFMLPELQDVFGELSAEEVADSLGTPLVDLDREVISYLEQTLDDMHIIDIEYGGMFDEFYEVVIDG